MPGIDCTGEFEAVGHSDEAKATLEQFYIGDLVVRFHHFISQLSALAVCAM
jgi:cytochrome b involved in lipid metabolism